ncbi:transposase [Streptomyces sp. NPDC057557]|uniref:IS110 family transposase n=1 Tax=Streptomyces sp. NPDC057557 TaxID=3346167 RepID=UPI0036AE87BC
MESVTTRLVHRFGPQVAEWCADTPDLIARLASRWGLSLGESLPDGASSVVLRCRWPDGTPAVLKISPERSLLAEQVEMLGWFAASGRVPSVHPLRAGNETVIDLKILTGRRMDLVADRTRTVNRLRAQLTGIFPGLERALDLTNTGPLVLMTGYQTSAALRRIGRKRLETWPRNRRVLRAGQLAETALEAAERQHTSLPGEKMTARTVHTPATEVIALNQQVAELDKLIEARFASTTTSK